MRPIIGITTSVTLEREEGDRLRVYLNTAYSDAIYAAGGLPLLIAPPADPTTALLDEILDRVDGILFTGGHDLHPRHYHQ
ncbi:MAG: gamma-glutamyl-gamma-aminobutyrate hydrolase family protein, partial [Phycisphaerales bacterium]|nr:gamma-glutamyl-gamma-aminobutyrate hydrolase family protein [Phycisphaerales bacterium]